MVGATGYYRMLAMVSQKSMKRLGYNLDAYELGKALPDADMAVTIARHFNRIISVLIEANDTIDVREFDLWRGMAAGAQAQGSWQNSKGVSAEIAIREIILRRLQERGFVDGSESDATRITLSNGRTLVFADEPDIAIYENDLPQITVEVKGGIDSAGVLERIGAALKSLQRTRQENPHSQTILILQDVSMTDRARADLDLSTGTITHLFSTTALLEDEAQREALFRILNI